MSENFDSRLTKITHKMGMLMQRFALMQAQRDEANRKIEDLEKQLDTYRKQVDQLTTQVEYLQVVTTIEPTSAELKKSREFLSELVWEIDKCITQLSE